MPTTVCEKLISTTMPMKIRSKKRVIVEGKDGRRPVTRVVGLFQRANYINSNGRMYPKEVLEEAIKNLQEGIKKRSVLGELGHPDTAKVNLERTSHLVTKVWMEGNNVYGECEILEDMPSGRMLKTLIDNDVCISVSSRGTGDLEMIREGNQDYMKVLPGYSIVTWDAVHEPSVAGTELAVLESKGHKINLVEQYERELLAEIRKRMQV